MLLLAAAIAAASPNTALIEARHALGAGRLDQARAMIATAVQSGASGDPVDRLLADLAYVQGDDERSAALCRALFDRHPSEARLAECAGISSLRLERLADAETLLRSATVLPGAGWRAWNGLAAVADRRGDWGSADRAYDRALALAPHQAAVANNRGWSLLLRGRWREAEAELARGVALDPAMARLNNNLDLARAALQTALPARRAAESDEAWAGRLNDAGVAAAVRGERARAIAAFARALDARSRWDRRAAANLAAIERDKDVTP